MIPSSDSITETTRKSVSLVLKGLSDNGVQTTIAKAIGASDATVSRFKNEHLEQFIQIITLCGLKIVPTSDVTINEDRLNALILLSHHSLATPEELRKAVMDERK